MRVERQVLFWLAALLLVGMALLLLKDVLLPFLIGIVIAYALNPAAERLAAIGLGRTAASALLVAIMVVVIAVLLVFLVPLLLNQIQSLGLTMPGEIERLRGVLDAWAKQQFGDRFADYKAIFDRVAAEASANWSSVATVIARSVWTQGVAILNFLSVLLITPLVVFYILVDWNPMLAKIETWLPRDHRATITRLATDINDAISAFIRGQGLVCVALGIIYAIGLSAVGLRYGLLIGLWTGALSFVPFIGWAVGLITAMIFALLQFGPDALPLLKVFGIFALGQVIDAAFLSPKIVGSRIGLHPVWLIASLIIFSYLFGFAGVLVAVPVAAAVAVLVRFALEVYLNSSIYKGESNLPPAGTL